VVSVTVEGTHKASAEEMGLPPGAEDDPFFQFFRGIPGFGQRGRGRFADQPADPLVRERLRCHEFLELEEERRILVTGEQPEQQAVGELERPSVPRPPQLQQPAVLRDGPDVLDALGRRRGEPKQVGGPDAGLLLLLRDGYCRPGCGNGSVGLSERLGRRIAVGCQLPEGAVADRLPPVLNQPGEGNPMLGNEFQRRSGARER